jgi:peptide/nickel transport system substrate-binding protein
MKRHHTARVLFTLSAAVVLIATACTPTTPSSGGSESPSASEQPVAGGRVIEGSTADIKTLNPILVNDSPSSVVVGLMFEPLILQDPKSGEPKPRLATWTQSSDGKTITFEINAKANWTDGKPVIGEDVLTGIKAIGKSKKTPRKSNYADVDGFKDYSDGKSDTIPGVKVDPANPKKVSITFTKVSCPALLDVSNYYTLPTQTYGKYVTSSSKDEIDTAPENSNPQVTDGPFKFKEWRQGDQVILTKNTDFYMGAPLLDEYVVKVVADQTILAQQLKTGELNYANILPKDLADIERQDTLKVVKYISPGYTYIGWRQNSPTAPALSDKKVRQALAYGLNMDDVIKSVLFGEGFKQVQHFLSVSWAYPKSGMNMYDYNPTKAEDLIKEAGYTKGSDGIYQKDGKKISFSILTNADNPSRVSLMQVAAEQYKKIGVEAKPKTEAFTGIVDKLVTANPEIEAVVIGWTGLQGDPDPYGIWHSDQIPGPGKQTFGFTLYKNDALDKAIIDGRNPANGDCSIASRQKAYETVAKILNEDQPYNFGFGQNTLATASKNLQNFAPTTYTARYNVNTWWFKK